MRPTDLAAALESLDEGVLVLDAAGDVIEANSVAAVLLGEDGRPLAGRPDPLTARTALRPDGSPWPELRLTMLAHDGRRAGSATTAPVRRHVIGLAGSGAQGPVRWLSIAVAHVEPSLWVVSVIAAAAPGPVPVAGSTELYPAAPWTDGGAYAAAFESAPIGMVLVEVDERGRGRTLRLNSIMRSRIWALDADEVGVDVRRWIHPEDRPPHVERFKALCAGTITDISYEVRFRGSDGTHRRCWIRATAHGRPRAERTPGRPWVTHLVYHVVDITERHEAERQLERLALTDPVTGLGNRLRIEQSAAAALERAAPGTGVGVMALDLDRFTRVNDALGHTAGDAVLIEAGLRLQRALPAGAVVARLGGDEFAALVEGVSGAEELLDLAYEVLVAMEPDYTLPSGATVTCTASIGLTVASEGTAADVQREAGLALAEAKQGGRNRCAIFDSRLRQHADRRNEAERRLRLGLAAGEVRMDLQPVTDLCTGRRVGAEALARLVHPAYGVLLPVDFVDVAEETGLIVEIDARIAELAVARLVTEEAGALPTVSVNVSPRSLASPEYLRRLTGAVRASGVDPARLLVEVTERVLLDEAGAAAVGMEALHDLGARVGIDDFGTGYSALAYLTRFDLDFLKVDRSFVTGLGRDPRAASVVAAIVALAHAHDMVVTAEGVETAEQAAALRAMGCDSGQGWYFGRPATPVGAVASQRTARTRISRAG